MTVLTNVSIKVASQVSVEWQHRHDETGIHVQWFVASKTKVALMTETLRNIYMLPPAKCIDKTQRRVMITL